mgnify:CR=1 FL=1
MYVYVRSKHDERLADGQLVQATWVLILSKIPGKLLFHHQSVGSFLKEVEKGRNRQELLWETTLDEERG